MTERIDQPEFVLWLLLKANRELIALGLAALTFLTIVLLSTAAPTALRELMVQDQPVGRLFQALTVSLITGVTLVITINQLVLSQEIGAVADQRTRLEGSLKFREDLGTVLDDPVVPSRPDELFDSLMAATAARARDFAECADAAGVEEEVLEPFVESTLLQSRSVRADLGDATFGTFSVIAPVLGFDYSERIVEAEAIEAAHAARFDVDTSIAHHELIQVLELFGVSREHFKTLYFQWALVDLSRSILVLFVPALIVTILSVLFLDPTTADVMIWRVDGVALVVALAATISISPFLLVVSYLLRVATVAMWTLAIGPFVLRE